MKEEPARSGTPPFLKRRNPLGDWFLQFVETERSRPATRRWAALTVLAALAATYAIVYATGGTRYSYAHFAYVPIVIGAFSFGIRGGLLTGLAAGLLMGPPMPLEVESGTAQSMHNWLVRASFFLLIGALSGIAADLLRRQVKALSRQAYRDRMTRLPNRAAYLERIEAVLAARRPSDPPVVALTVGIGNFEELILSFGYPYADQLYRVASDRLLQLLSPETELFAIRAGLFATIHRSAEEARSIGAKFARALGERFEIGGIPTLSSGHVGIAMAQEGIDALTLTRESIACFHRAEKANEAIVVHDGRFDRLRQSTLRLLPDLQEAIRSGNCLSLHYQPILDLKTGHCKGAEALLRWEHPELGPIPPGDFIPAAEKTALMGELTRLVIDRSLRQMKQWQAEGFELDFYVNISVRDLEDERFAASTAKLLSNHAVPAPRLVLEVTENALMRDPAAAMRSLARLRQLGVGVALDDFGTGQSSLSYLAKLPVDVIKLDASFAHEVEADPQVGVVVRLAVDAAHQLGQKVVAEGIETRSALQKFQDLSCDFGQGYLLSRPLAADTFRGWLFDHRLSVLRGKDAFAGQDPQGLRRMQPH
ncbi:GGDEF domain-containing phosphodiesterase [Chelativorans sp.]|uniref:putative bifunctional diguanylate cyclase/phosphodiesterase n=1 Tax=Chelativorans sp. TaxID=2203393 RepID=UPI0028117D99|nr:GGDEF domain-containing phosphodiesterase [Chelativorans sp.]